MSSTQVAGWPELLEDLLEEELCAVVLRVRKEVLGRADLNDLAGVHEDDAVGHAARKALSLIHI